MSQKQGVQRKPITPVTTCTIAQDKANWLCQCAGYWGQELSHNSIVNAIIDLMPQNIGVLQQAVALAATRKAGKPTGGKRA